MNALFVDREGNAPNNRQVPDQGLFQGMGVTASHADGSVKRLEGLGGGGLLDCKPSGWSGAKRVEDEDGEEQPDDRHEAVATGSLLRFWDVRRGEWVAHAAMVGRRGALGDTELSD